MELAVKAREDHQNGKPLYVAGSISPFGSWRKIEAEQLKPSYSEQARILVDQGANLFANHIYNFGDQHAAITLGPDRARRMNACRTALDTGVPLAIHSDAPVTPLGPLTTAWAAVNHLTGSDKVLGENQRISVGEALHAITMRVAYTLHMYSEIGSIETGKWADFAVLDEDPTRIVPEKLNKVPVRRTVLAGQIHPVQ